VPKEIAESDETAVPSLVRSGSLQPVDVNATVHAIPEGWCVGDFDEEYANADEESGEQSEGGGSDDGSQPSVAATHSVASAS